MPEHSRDESTFNYRTAAGALVVVILSLVAYIFVSTVQAQKDATDSVARDVSGIRDLLPKIQETNAKLTAIIEQHESRIKQLETQK